MHPDSDQPPAWPDAPLGRSILLLWIALALAGWIVLAACAFLTYLAVTLLT